MSDAATTPTGRESSGGTGATNLDAEQWPEAMADLAAPAELIPGPRTRPRSPAAHVTAVVVAHNGARWLGEVLASLRSQSRPLDRIIAADTGSRDDGADLLRDALGVGCVVTLEGTVGFGAAVAAALAGPGRTTRAADGSGDLFDGGASTQWLWLIHDDCAPDPDALAQLLNAAASAPDIAVAGPKLRGWHDRRRLLETGVTIARSGRRETGLEPNEMDQGQHDDVRDVLAVSSAGMLVRRDAWDRLGGFDPRLPLFRDDVDFGWRVNRAGLRVVAAPGAVVHHVGAASVGRRTIDAATRRRHLLDRRSALFVLLANLPGRALPWAYVRLTASSLLRAAGFALGKLPGAAIDELAAIVAVLTRPDRVIAARRTRRDDQTAPATVVAPLLPRRGAQLARGLDTLAGVFAPTSRSTHSGADISARGHRSVQTGPGDDELQDLEPVSLRWLRSLFNPGFLLISCLLVVALLAARELLGTGRLMDGALLPAPDGARDLWRAYIGTWHDVGLGSDELAPPYLAVVAVLATLLFGNAPLAVDVLLIGAVPLAGLTAWFATRRLLHSSVLRAWAAGTYALLPATTGAIAGGRLGTAVAIVMAPLIASSAAQALMNASGPADEDASGAAPRSGGQGWPAAFASGLFLSVATAFVPMAYAITVAVVVVVGLAVARSTGAWARIVTISLLPPALLLPWSAQLATEPGRLLLEAGLPGLGLSDPGLEPVSILLQSSGGPGSIPWWLGVPLLVGGLAALLSVHRRVSVLVGWVIVAAGLGAGVLISSATVATSTAAASAAGWPGLSVAVVAGGLILATAVGAEGSGDRLTRSDFGWRQPLALTVALVAAVAPLAFAVWWVGQGAGDPLSRQDQVVVPEFVAAEADNPSRPRTVVLRRSADGSISYSLLRGSGPRLGDAETGPATGAYGLLDEAIADLVSGRGGEDLDVLSGHAVQYVMVATPVADDLVASLDAVSGLQRTTTSGGAALWRLDEPTARLRLIDASGGPLALLPAGREGADATVPPGAAGRVAVLAEPADEHWVATLDGAEAPVSAAGGWAQAFEVPAGGGELVVRYESDSRARWLLAQALLTAIVLVLAVPGVRRDLVGP